MMGGTGATQQATVVDGAASGSEREGRVATPTPTGTGLTTSVRALDRDAAQSVLDALPRNEWLAAAATCRTWRQAAMHQRSRAWSLQLEASELASVCTSPLLTRHFPRVEVCLTRATTRDVFWSLLDLDLVWVREVTLRQDDCPAPTAVDLMLLIRATRLEALTFEGFVPSPDQTSIITRRLPSLRRLAFGRDARDRVEAGFLANWLDESHALGQLTDLAMPSLTVGPRTLHLFIDACPRMERFGPVKLTSDECLLHLRRWSHLRFVDLNLWNAEASTELLETVDRGSLQLSPTSDNACDESTAAAGGDGEMQLEVIVRDWPEAVDDVRLWHTFLDGRTCLPRRVTSLHLSSGNALSRPAHALFAVPDSASHVHAMDPFGRLTRLTLELPFATEYGNEFEALGRAAPQLSRLTLLDCQYFKCAEVKRLALNGGGASLESLVYRAHYHVPARLLAQAAACRRLAPNRWSIAERTAAFRPPSALFPALRTFVYEETPTVDPWDK